MSKTTSQLLSQTQDAISALLTALADNNVQEYDINGRRIKRADFPGSLAALQRMEQFLKRRAAQESGGMIRVAKLGRPRRVDR